MRKITSLLAILSVVIISGCASSSTGTTPTAYSSTTETQNSFGARMQNKVNDKVEQKVDSLIDKVFDNIMNEEVFFTSFLLS